MKLGDALKALFLMPAARPASVVRCITHDVVFSESMDASFHETMNLNCKWEKLNEERPPR
jgi:hypothetical protein